MNINEKLEMITLKVVDVGASILKFYLYILTTVIMIGIVLGIPIYLYWFITILIR